jgi:hypothetical protein
MQTEREYFTSEIKAWRKDAELFVRQVLGAVPDRWQSRALRLISNPRTRRLAFKACKGPGKTAVLAWIILWFLTCHYESKVGCTSITEDNINTNLWPELLKWINRSSFLRATFVWTKTQVTRRGNENWFAVKRTWPKTGDSQQQADALAGIHADDVMFVLDESGGIPQAVMVTAEAVLSTLTEALERAGHRAIVVQSGNPTHTTGPLYRACTVDRALWEVITITGDPDDPDRSPRISLEWAREEIRKYGRDNPWVMVNVLGEFPPSSINALLGVEEVERAMRRHYRREVYQYAEKRLGVDVARFGDDRTCIAPRQGLAAFKPLILRQADTVQIATAVAKGFLDWRAAIVLIDDSGHWGHGVVDMLTNSSIPTIPMRGEDKSPDKRFKNLRSFVAFEIAKWVKAGGALPHKPELIPEFTEPTYTFVGGVFVLEPKDKIKERLGYSPDYFDALGETFTLPDAPAGVLEALKKERQGAKVAHDFDPFEMFPELDRDTVGSHLTDFNPFETEIER